MAFSRSTAFGLWLLVGSVLASAQQYTISTYAGGGLQNGVQGTAFALGGPNALAIDSAGTLYIPTGNAIYKLTPQGTMTLLTGTGYPLLFEGGVQGPISNFSSGLALDSQGNLYFVQNIQLGPGGSSSTIQKLTVNSGTVTTVAGNGALNGNCGSNDGGLAINTKLCGLYVALDAAGSNLYISDLSKIRKINLATGIITTVAGNGTIGFSGDGGPAVNAEMWPAGIALDSSGNLYIADQPNFRVRRVDATTGIIGSYLSSR